MVSFEKARQIRHNRIIDLRKKVVSGWSMKTLLHFCEMKLGVTRVTAMSYIDEAAEPYRKKFNEEQDKNG